MSYFGLLDSAWALVMQKSSKVVVQNMESRGGDAVWGCWMGFSDS